MDRKHKCETKTFRSIEKLKKIHTSQYSYNDYVQ